MLPRLHPTKGRNPTEWMKPPPSKAQCLPEASTPQTQGLAKGASLLANQQSLQLLLLRKIISLQVKVEVGFSPLLSWCVSTWYSLFMITLYSLKFGQYKIVHCQGHVCDQMTISSLGFSLESMKYPYIFWNGRWRACPTFEICVSKLQAKTKWKNTLL